MHVASNSHFGGLWGHGSLKTASMASEVKFELRFEVSIFNYPGIYVHIASNCHFDGFWGYSDLQTASEAASDLTIELSDLNNLCCHASLASKCFHEMIKTDVRQRQRGDLSSIDLRGYAAGKNKKEMSFKTFGDNDSKEH